ncbi:MAG: aldehyde dehydrogenase family protein [Actinobacteria bacterium]|nr:aldehyde dehydrogenase family protein [Actinomycetota bacterium]
MVEREFPSATSTDIADAISRADAAHAPWSETPLAERAAVLQRVADLYRDRKDELADIIAREMGKPVRQGRGEAGFVGDIYEFYATRGPGCLADQDMHPMSGGHAIVRSQSLGVLLGIMPWNYPYYQVARFAGPNLLIGNTVILKHASNCPESALAQEQIFRDAGLPEGAYINLFVESRDIETIIADPRVQGVSLTGSEKAGAAVAQAAGRSLKKVVLELGGSDPFIVLDAENLDVTIAAAASGRMSNAGQACTAAKRFIVVDSVYDRFVDGFAEQLQTYIAGDPRDSETNLGPLSSLGAVEELIGQVDDAVANGATLVTGGHRVGDVGSFMAPTLLTNVPPAARAFSEELFGPVAVVYRVSDKDEAIALANGSEFGLSGAVFGANADDTRYVADRLESGMVYINENTDSHVDLPFGGIKKSGFGRELGHFGLDEFVNKKLIRTAAR